MTSLAKQGAEMPRPSSTSMRTRIALSGEAEVLALGAMARLRLGWCSTPVVQDSTLAGGGAGGRSTSTQKSAMNLLQFSAGGMVAEFGVSEACTGPTTAGAESAGRTGSAGSKPTTAVDVAIDAKTVSAKMPVRASALVFGLGEPLTRGG